MRIDKVKLAAAMAKYDLSVNELAKRACLSRSTVTAVRGGKKCSQSTAEKLASVLGWQIVKGGRVCAAISENQ